MNMVHTTIETKDGWTRMVYHGTCVAEMRHTSCLDPKDPRAGVIVRLNTGGYFTKTTKKRMNQFAEMFNLGFRVYQEVGEWFVQCNTGRDENGGGGYNGKVTRFDGPSYEFTVSK